MESQPRPSKPDTGLVKSPVLIWLQRAGQGEISLGAQAQRGNTLTKRLTGDRKPCHLDRVLDERAARSPRAVCDAEGSARIDK